MLLLLMVAAPLQAHTRSASYAQWTLDAQGGAVQLRVSQLDLSRLALDPRLTPNYRDVLAAQLTEEVQLWSGATRCSPGPAVVRETDGGWMQLGWRADCEAAPTAVRTRLLEAVAPSHLHFVRVQAADGSQHHRVLGYADPVLEVGGESSVANAGLSRYFGLGVVHILGGWDHLLFLLMLLLLAQRLRDLVWLISAFTVAHSLTLAASVLGAVQVREVWVEGLIAWSILLVAVETLWLRAGRDPWIPWILLMTLAAAMLVSSDTAPWTLWLGLLLITACYFGLLDRSHTPLTLRAGLAFAFGLIHGFGFAGELLSLSLPREQLAVALLGFNLGVEAGQLLVMAAVCPLRVWLGQGLRREARVIPGLATLAIVAAAQAWWMRMVI